MGYNSNDNVIKTFGSFSSNKDTRGGATPIPSAVIGIVKNNVDPAHSGKIDVYLIRQDSGLDQDNPAYWTSVNYMSPFFGYTTNTSSTSDDGKFVGNPNSYGMWMTPPDINTEVICVFLNGDPSQGYYIGSLPKPGITQMVPAIGSSSKIIANGGEASSYGGAKTLPVSEINNANPEHSKNPKLSDQPRTVHSYQAAILNKQGLIRDQDRGTISSSSTRESPSHVFGISTPGRPIYKGGYTNDTIQAAISDSSTPDDKFKIIGRLGGHTFVMDDGDVTGKDQLMRMRTATGHMIMMNDKAQTLFIIHANGKSYIELGKEGTIDMYAMNSVNIRTQGDLNLHADRNVNIKALKDVNISGENFRTESLKETSSFVGTTYRGYVKGEHTLKTESKMSIATTGEFGIKSKNSAVVLDGKNVKLNSGDPALTPAEVKQLPIVQHPDTLFSDSVGWAAAPGKLSSIVSRAPAHSPWSYANMGVDVKVNQDSSSAFPSPPSSSVQAANNSAPATPNAVTSPAIAATSPSVNGGPGTLDTATSRSMASQVAVNAQSGPLADAAKAGAGVVNGTGVIGAYGLSPQHLDDAGFIKPGSSSAVQQCLNSGKSLADSMPNAIFTGKNGITNVNQFINDTASQASCVNTLLQNSQQNLTNLGAITGNESAAQTGGLIMSGAIAGVGNTLKAVGGNLGKIDATSATSALNAVPSPAVSSVLNLLAAGNYAGALVDKTMQAFSNLGGIDIASKFTSTASNLFSNIIAKFKPLTANVPQDLSSIGTAASSGLDQAASASGLNNLPGGASGLTNLVDNAASTAIASTPGASQLNGIANAVSGGAASLNALTGQGTKSITNLATAGLSLADSNALLGKVNALSSGTLDVKLPVVASNTVDQSGLVSQSKKLLGGDNRIPPLDIT